MKRVIAIDLGASNGRVIMVKLVNRKFELRELHRFSNAPIEQGKRLFWDISSLMHEIKVGLKKYMDTFHEPLDGIGVDTWGVDFGLISKEDTLLDNPYSYRGPHTDGMMKEVEEQISSQTLFEKTGVEPASINTLYQLAGIFKERPELVEETATILTMPSLINFLLTGEKYNEYTHASTTQLLNHDTQEWDVDIMKAVFSKILPLAKIKETNTIMGTTKKTLNDQIGSNPIPVINIPGHDTACALAAMPIKDKRSAFMSCGTWILIGTEVDKPVVSKEAYEWGFTNEGTADHQFRLQKNNMGLWLLQQTKKEWKNSGESVAYDEEADLIAEATPFQSIIDPDHDMFFNPTSMIQAIKAFCSSTGQVVPETKGEVMRCILESLALKYRWTIERLEQLVGYEIPVIHMGGGGIQNAMLCQFVSSATQKPVEAGPIEASAIGNALSQFIALGEFDNLAEAREVSQHSFASVSYKPEDTAKWDAAYTTFLTYIS